MRDLLFYITRGGSRRYKILALFFLSSIAFTNAQTKVSGIVSDSKGLTLPGVNVTIKGTQNGVVTDFDGKYEINVQPKTILVYTFIGFTSQEIAVNDKKTISVFLQAAIMTKRCWQ